MILSLSIKDAVYEVLLISDSPGGGKFWLEKDSRCKKKHHSKEVTYMESQLPRMRTSRSLAGKHSLEAKNQ
jgi:hypothetical protein